MTSREFPAGSEEGMDWHYLQVRDDARRGLPSFLRRQRENQATRLVVVGSLADLTRSARLPNFPDSLAAETRQWPEDFYQQ